MNKADPVNPQSRLDFVDILRGFALFGVLAANMTSFSGYGNNPHNYSDFLDVAILVGIQFFIRAKFYSLFSFLFGWGMSVQMLRAAEKGHRFRPVFIRRMAILLTFGLIHGMVIWSGDILTLYALLGLILLLFRKRSERTLLILVVLLLLYTIVLNLPVEAMNNFRTWYAEVTSFMRQGNLPDSVLADGGLFIIVRKTTQDFWSAQSWLIYYIGGVFSMFLLGLYAGKRRIFQNVEDHLPLLRRTLFFGLIIGVIFNGIFVWNTLHPELDRSAIHPFCGHQCAHHWRTGLDALLRRRHYSAHAPANLAGTLTAVSQCRPHGAEQLPDAVCRLCAHILWLWHRALRQNRSHIWHDYHHSALRLPNTHQPPAS